MGTYQLLVVSATSFDSTMKTTFALLLVFVAKPAATDSATDGCGDTSLWACFKAVSDDLDECSYGAATLSCYANCDLNQLSKNLKETHGLVFNTMEDLKC